VQHHIFPTGGQRLQRPLLPCGDRNG
jgi:hypothetical protein